MADISNRMNSIVQSELSLANIYIEQNKVKLAIDILLKAKNILISRELKSEVESLIQIYNSLGNLYRKIDEFPLAKKFYEKAIELQSNYGFEEAVKAKTYNNVGNYYLEINQNLKAIEYLNKAAQFYLKRSHSINKAEEEIGSQILGNLGVAYLNLFIANKDVSTFNLASHSFLSSTSFDSGNYWSFYHWGVLYEAISNTQEGEEKIKSIKQAKENYIKSNKINNDFVAPLFNLANILVEASRQDYKSKVSLLKNAAEHLEQVVEKEPDNHRAWNNLGISQSTIATNTVQENIEESIYYFNNSFKALRKAIAINEKETEANYNLGLSLFNYWVLIEKMNLVKSQVLIEARDHLQKAIDFNDKRSMYYLQLAVVELALSDEDKTYAHKAKSNFEKANALKIIDKKYLNAWGNSIVGSHAKRHNKDKAESSIKQMRGIVEKGGSVYNMACLESLVGKKSRAFKYLEEAFKKEEVDVKHVRQDEDWKHYWADEDFLELMEKYSR